MSLQQQFGAIDIYLFDQVLRGNIAPGMTILDAGCGHGRNLVYFLQNGYTVYAVDRDPSAVEYVRHLAHALGSHNPPENFRVCTIEGMPFPDALADVVLINSVLHFAADDVHFNAMLTACWRVLKPGGLLFCRLASTVGMTHRHVTGRRFISPDGEERYLVDEDLLLDLTVSLGGTLIDPLKTTVVHRQRCMTTWVVRKNTPDVDYPEPRAG